MSALLLAVLLLAPARAGFPSRLKHDLVSLEGEPVKLSSFKDKVVLVYFWSTTCGPCRLVKPDLEALRERFADRGLVVLAVANGETGAVVRPFLEKHPTTLQAVTDPRRLLARALLLRGEPAFALFDTNERLVWSAAAMGPATLEDLAWRLDRALPGGPGSVPLGKLPRP